MINLWSDPLFEYMNIPNQKLQLLRFHILIYDDQGKLFWIDNTRPLKAAQFHPKYWKTVHRLGKNLPAGDPVSLGNSYEPTFTKATSICLTGDRGGQVDPARCAADGA